MQVFWDGVLNENTSIKFNSVVKWGNHCNFTLFSQATLAKCKSIVGQQRPGDVEQGENILIQLQQHLHPNHAFCTEMKTSLVSSYALLKNKTVKQFDRQLELAEQVLRVMDVIDPGMTPRRGGMLKHVVEIKMKRANLQVRVGGWVNLKK